MNAKWRDVCLTVTAAWAVLASMRVLFYALERMRFPDLVPPVSADAVQVILLWPIVVLGCYLTLMAWRRLGVQWAAAVAIALTLMNGAIARPTYGVATLLITPSDQWGPVWLKYFHLTLAGSWAPWLANGVEYAVIYISSIAIALGFLSFRNFMNERLLRTKVEAIAAQERLRGLRAQLNPHFLFNTLNSIVSLSDLQPASAQRVMTQLSDLLRRTLHASERDEQALVDELAHAEAYLRIQQIRRPLRITWQVSLTPECSNALVPSLILLPLVENAVTHGLWGGAHAVEIDIEAHAEGGRLVIVVNNTCLRSRALRNPGHSGLGLRNVRERLQVLFGAEGTLEAQRLEPDRFEARLQLPLTDSCEAPPRLLEAS
jgi:two-component sensor histidine kinase